MPIRQYIIGIDVGGTFTDAVVLDARDGTLLAAFKLPSTPDDPGRAVIEAVDRIATEHPLAGALVCHGTTVGTNTLIERRGASTALVTTRGFADVIALRRQARPRLYDLSIEISAPLVPDAARLEVEERIAADGSVVKALDGLDALIAEIRRTEAEAVAVSFINAYANPAHEEAAAAAIRTALPDVYVTHSTDVCPEFREYERTSTAVLNAYIGPVVSRYMARLDKALGQRSIDRLMVVKSNGGLTSPANAARFPVHLIESGPAAGLAAAAAYARAAARPHLIAFDMGGTTAKVGLIRDGEPETAAEFYANRLVEGRDVGGYAIRSPVLDIVEIGAGGGSIAGIDEAGVLKVGPRSAGAVPGPACYSRGGTLPTVTDAHAVIGTLSAELFGGTGIAFDRRRAEEAIRRHIAEPYGWPLARAAYAIIDIAVANMAEMVRLATVQRGIDPRSFAMLASGGAGPLHAASVAREIGIPEVIVPPYSGMFSALGATLGQIRHEVVQTLLREVPNLSRDEIESDFAQLAKRTRTLLAQEPAGIGEPRFDRFVDARFTGQMFELKLAFGPNPITPAGIEAAFRAAYRAEYGFDLPGADVQVVNLRLLATQSLGFATDTILTEHAPTPAAASSKRQIPILGRDGTTEEVPFVVATEAGGLTIEGPAIISHQGSTVWLERGQFGAAANDGRLLIKPGSRT
jgi:N-methylhydantoinase A